MNAVGIDVSKGKSMVTILRPFGEIVSSPFEIKHTSSDIHSLIKLIHSIEGESRVVMEHTGRYYEALAHQQISLSVLLIPSWSKILITILFARSSPTKLILSRLPATLLTNGKVLNRIVLQMNYALS